MFESSHLLYLDLQVLLKISILLLPTPHCTPQNIVFLIVSLVISKIHKSFVFFKK